MVTDVNSYGSKRGKVRRMKEKVSFSLSSLNTFGYPLLACCSLTASTLVEAVVFVIPGNSQDLSLELFLSSCAVLPEKQEKLLVINYPSPYMINSIFILLFCRFFSFFFFPPLKCTR